jgi:hypothetical protein
MRELAVLTAASIAMLLAPLGAGAAFAVPGGDLSVLTKGHYACELPGDSGDPALFGGRPQPDLDFDIIGDSSYRAKGGRGIYLLTGDTVRFTTGEFHGRELHRVGHAFLRAIGPDGKDGDLRCVSSSQERGLVAADNSRCKRAQQKAAKDKLAGRARDDEIAC